MRFRSPALGSSKRQKSFAVFHMHGYWDADGTQIVEAIRRSVGRINVPLCLGRCRPTRPAWDSPLLQRIADEKCSLRAFLLMTLSGLITLKWNDGADYR